MQPSDDHILDLMASFVNPGLARSFRFMGLTAYEVSAQGAWIEASDGNRYLDFSSGYGVMVHGYRHPRLVEAAKRQLDQLALSSRVLPSRQASELAALLAEVTPGDLTYSFFSNSGAEAIEGAIKFARVATGRTEMVATTGAFHGKTMGALTASGRDLYQRPFRPLVPDFVHVPYGDLGAARAVIGAKTAAVIVEPIQGEGGVVVPPAGYLMGLQEACRKHGALLVMDEVQTGMGRTGQLWACMHEGIEPDLMVMAKGLGGGILPIGATIGTPRAMAFWDEMPLIHTSTFGGNPLATAVAAEAIRVVQEEGLAERAATLGKRLAEAGRELVAAHPEVVREVRGRGLMAGLEVAHEGLGGALMFELFQRHMLAVYTLNNPLVIRLMPPLVIAEGDFEDGISRLQEAVAAVSAVAAQLTGGA